MICTWNDESRSLFLRLLASGPALLQVWEEIDFVDIPGRLIPEWLAIRNRPSASAAHRYTIDRHSVEDVTRLVVKHLVETVMMIGIIRRC